MARADREGRLHPLNLWLANDPQTVEEANANPDTFAKKTVGQVAEHFGEVIARLLGEACDTALGFVKRFA